MSLTENIAQDRRAAILVTVTEMPGGEINEDTLKVALTGLAHRVTSDVLRGDLQWLKDQALIRIEEREMNRGTLWIVHLLTKGLDVASGAPHPGVARPRLT